MVFEVDKEFQNTKIHKRSIDTQEEILTIPKIIKFIRIKMSMQYKCRCMFLNKHYICVSCYVYFLKSLLGATSERHTWIYNVVEFQ